MLDGDVLLTNTCREQDKPGYKPGLWACMTGSLIIIVIVIITDIHFYFKNKKQARGELILEPVDGTDSSVSFVTLLVLVGRMLTIPIGQVQVHLLSLTGWMAYGCDDCTEH